MDRAVHSNLTKFVVAMLVALSLFFSHPKAFADKFNTETSSSVEMLGMGNAGINASRGPYSVFYNPANIAAKNTGMHIQAVNIQMEASEGLVQTARHGSFNFQSLSSMYGDLSRSYNTYAAGR